MIRQFRMKYYAYEKSDLQLLIHLSKKGLFWDRLNTVLVTLGLSMTASWILSTKVNLFEDQKLQFWLFSLVLFMLLFLFFSFKRYSSLQVYKKNDVFVINRSIVLERKSPLHIYRREIVSAEGSGTNTIKLSYLNKEYDLLRGVGDKDALEIVELLIGFLEQDSLKTGLPVFKE